MNTLQELLTTLGSQQLAAGYLTPGGATAHDTLRALKQQFDPIVLLQNPITPPALLMTPAWVGSLGVGQDAIWLNGVNGRLDLSHGGGPAYVFQPPGYMPPLGGGGPTTQNYSLFASLTPTTSGNQAGGINLGITFTISQAGQVTAVRFYRGANSTVTSGFIGAIWTVTGQTKLQQVNFTGVSGTGWQQQALTTPISVVPGTQYVASVLIPDGNFQYSSSNPPITTGVLQAPTGLGLYNATGSLAYPINNQSNVNYFVDLVLNA